MIKEITLPDLGEGIDGAEVSEIPVSPGDTVSPDDTILVLESDKASMEIPSEVSGTISEILISSGDEVITGQLLLKIEVADGPEKGEQIKEEVVAPEPEPKDDPAVTQQTAPQLETQPSSNKGVFASPGVRRLSRELGINLEGINGSGPKGRITKDDLHAYIKLQMVMSSGPLPRVKKEIDFST